MRRVPDPASLFLLVSLACGRRDDGTVRLAATDTVKTPRMTIAEQSPVAVDATSPVEYPAPLLDQNIEGRVLLRMYADSAGALAVDSTRIAESSGYPALDSAAVAGAARLHFAPALLRGRPVAGAFLQPVQFRNPRRRNSAP